MNLNQFIADLRRPDAVDSCLACWLPCSSSCSAADAADRASAPFPPSVCCAGRWGGRSNPGAISTSRSAPAASAAMIRRRRSPVWPSPNIWPTKPPPAASLPTVTTSDPTSVLLAEDAVRRPYIRQGNLSDFPRGAARLPALNPTQYAAATMDLLNHEPVLTNIMSGTFGSEAALIDQAANNNDLPQLFGGSDPRALAVMSTSTDHILMGEEMYAAKAYLRAQPPHLASLRAADVVRIVIAVLIVIAFVVGLSEVRSVT